MYTMTIRAEPMAIGARGADGPDAGTSAITERKTKVPTSSVSSFAGRFMACHVPTAREADVIDPRRAGRGPRLPWAGAHRRSPHRVHLHHRPRTSPGVLPGRPRPDVRGGRGLRARLRPGRRHAPRDAGGRAPAAAVHRPRLAGRRPRGDGA